MFFSGRSYPQCSKTEGSAAVGAEPMRRVTRIATAILAADIGDSGVGALGLDPARSDQRALRHTGDAVSLTRRREAYGVVIRHDLNRPPPSIVVALLLVMPGTWRRPGASRH